MLATSTPVNVLWGSDSVKLTGDLPTDLFTIGEEATVSFVVNNHSSRTISGVSLALQQRLVATIEKDVGFCWGSIIPPLADCSCDRRNQRTSCMLRKSRALRSLWKCPHILVSNRRSACGFPARHIAPQCA